MKELLKIISERRSSRMPFDMGKEVPEKDLLQVLEAARWTPTAHNMQNFEIIVVNNKKQLEAIAGIKRGISEVFVRENYNYLSFSEEELKKKKMGIMGTMFPKSWQNPNFKLSDLGKEPDSAQRPVPSAPVLMFVIYDSGKRAPASEGDFLGIMSLGCVMQNMWLMAHSLGLGVQIVSSLASEESVTELRKIMKFKLPWKIGFVIRMGYQSAKQQPYLRVRRDIKNFVHYNYFENRSND
jgi:nitroreductase